MVKKRIMMISWHANTMWLELENSERDIHCEYSHSCYYEWLTIPGSTYMQNDYKRNDAHTLFNITYLKRLCHQNYSSPIASTIVICHR